MTTRPCQSTSCQENNAENRDESGSRRTKLVAVTADRFGWEAVPTMSSVPRGHDG